MCLPILFLLPLSSCLAPYVCPSVSPFPSDASSLVQPCMWSCRRVLPKSRILEAQGVPVLQVNRAGLLNAKIFQSNHISFSVIGRRDFKR